MSSDRPWLDSLRASSTALQGVLGALLEAERQFAPPASPLERLQEITTSPEWAWLQPLYRLIADVDHALDHAHDLPESESAAIGAHARELLSGGAFSAWGSAGAALPDSAARGPTRARVRPQLRAARRQ